MSDEVLKVVPTESAAAPAVKITVRPNGPFRVEGPISLVDVNGNEWDLTGKPAISLPQVPEQPARSRKPQPSSGNTAASSEFHDLTAN